MEKLDLTRKSLNSALSKLSEAIEHFQKLKTYGAHQASDLMNNEKLEESLRDSLIQRFEFCVDLFWKYTKKYLEDSLDIVPEANSPSVVIRAACKARIISEADSQLLIEMIKSRNLTSHIYKEEIANQISKNIPTHYLLMKKYAESLMLK